MKTEAVIKFLKELVLPAITTVLVAMATISFTTGQYVNKIEQQQVEIDSIKKEIKDTSKVVTDVEVIKTDIKYMSKSLEEIKDLLKNRTP